MPVSIRSSRRQLRILSGRQDSFGWHKDSIHVTIIKTQCEVMQMDTANTIKELREKTGMTRKEFSNHTGIPVRTLEDWEAGRRTPPEYIPRLIAYQLKYEEITGQKE